MQLSLFSWICLRIVTLLKFRLWMAVPLMWMFASQTAAEMLPPLPLALHATSIKTSSNVVFLCWRKTLPCYWNSLAFYQRWAFMTSQVCGSLSFISFHLYAYKKYLLIMSIQTFLRHTWIILNTFEISMFSIRDGMCPSLDTSKRWLPIDLMSLFHFVFFCFVKQVRKYIQNKRWFIYTS